MVVQIEGVYHHSIDKIAIEKMNYYLNQAKDDKKKKIEILAKKMEQYEKRRAAEETTYQSMSAFRKLFTGKRPDHHLAVEYMVYVKRPLQEIDGLTSQIKVIDQLLLDIIEEDKEIISLPAFIFNELSILEITSSI